MKHSASALIAAAKRDAPRHSLEGDILGALGVGTAVALAPSFGTKLWLALKHAAVSKVGIATIAFAAATGGYAAGRLQERAVHESAIAVGSAPTVAQTQTPTPARTQAQPPTPASAQATAPTVAFAVTSTSTVTETRAVTVTATAPTTVPSSPPPPTASLADEVAAIKRARAAILAKNADGALAALDDYDRAHPAGVMSEESLALRVRADRLAGDAVGAAETLTKLEQRFPESVQLSSLRPAR